MYIDGIIDKTHLEFMEKAGWEFTWKIMDKEQAIAYNNSFGDVIDIEMDFTTEAYARFYIDTDIEEYITAEGIVENLPSEDLPLAAVCNNNNIKSEALRLLKED